MINFELSSDQQTLREQARELSDTHLRPYAAKWDDEESFPERSYTEIRKAGFTGLTVPIEYGGKGLGVLEACLVLEELARGCLASAMTLQMNVNGPPRVIASLGSTAQKERFLPGVVDGSRYFAVAMTEPVAGSDGSALQTTLRKSGDKYLLSGGKCYITGGSRADSLLVFCRAPGTEGAYGIGAVLVESHVPGFHKPEVEPKMGSRGVPEATLKFDDIELSESDVVIPCDPDSKRGGGLLLRQFNPERCGNAAMSIGVAQAALDDAVTYAKTREQFGRPIVEFQGLYWKLADMALEIEAARLLTWQAASMDDEGFPPTRQTMMAKIYANEMAQRVTNKAIQIHGHKGYSRSHPIERYFRDARGMGIGGGTPEIMRNILAGEVAGLRFSQQATVRGG